MQQQQEWFVLWKCALKGTLLIKAGRNAGVGSRCGWLQWYLIYQWASDAHWRNSFLQAPFLIACKSLCLNGVYYQLLGLESSSG